MKEIPFSYIWNEIELLGIYHKVNCVSKKGVLFIHGLPGDRVDTRRIMVRMARELQKVGIPSVRVDLFSAGVSGGRTECLSYFDQIKQLYGILIKINQTKLWEKTILVAFSDGAKLALNLAEKYNKIIGICMCNGIIVKETFQYGKEIKRFYRRKGEMVYDIDCGLWINKRILEENERLCMKTCEELPKIPILGIYGSGDMATVQSRAFVKTYARLKIIKGADHLFTSSKWEKELINYYKEWCLKIEG